MENVSIKEKLAVLYVARGADPEALKRFSSFVISYKRFHAGVDHDLFILLKGFEHDFLIKREACDLFRTIRCTQLDVADNRFDLGAYQASLASIEHKMLCMLNTNSEILCEDWLLKLFNNMRQEGVGIVSATGSYESLAALGSDFPGFPNIHLRSTAFMLRRDDFLKVVGDRPLRNKREAWVLESGAEGFTRYMYSIGKDALMVGRNGRGYTWPWWSESEVFRLGNQDNLLVHDNVTRAFDGMSYDERCVVAQATWGDSIGKYRSSVFVRNR